MDKLTRYRDCIDEIMKRHSRPHITDGSEIQYITDIENDHYQIVHTGWNQKERLYGCLVHMDIKNGKIWIQQDGTEVGVAEELVKLGVPKEDIVLAYHPPYKRPYTGFGTG